MHTHSLDLNAIRQTILLLKTDVKRLQSHINQTPESHIGDVPVDPAYVPPPEPSSSSS